MGKRTLYLMVVIMVLAAILSPAQAQEAPQVDELLVAMRTCQYHQIIACTWWSITFADAPTVIFAGDLVGVDEEGNLYGYRDQTVMAVEILEATGEVPDVVEPLLVQILPTGEWQAVEMTETAENSLNPGVTMSHTIPGDEDGFPLKTTTEVSIWQLPR